MLTPIATPDTPEWHAARSTGFGASEAAAVAGLSQYETPLHVYMRKRGELPAVEETKPMRRGRRWEPYVLDTFVEETGLEIAASPCGLYRHPEHAFVLATPDAILRNGELVDAKTTTFRQAGNFGAEGSDEIPVEYVCQGQQQMAVLGVEVCHFAVMLDVWTLKVFTVHRNEELIKGLVDAEADLWDRIQSGNPPAPQWGHKRTVELIKALNRFVSDRVIELPMDAAEAWFEYERIGREISKAQEVRDQLKAKVLFAVGDAGAAILPDGESIIRRKRVTREAYTVDATEYVDVRKVKRPKGMKVSEPIEDRFRRAHELLTGLGFTMKAVSEAGSCYYRYFSTEVRVSDHPANEKTAAWMAREGVREVRVDDYSVDVEAAVMRAAAVEV